MSSVGKMMNIHRNPTVPWTNNVAVARAYEGRRPAVTMLEQRKEIH